MSRIGEFNGYRWLNFAVSATSLSMNAAGAVLVFVYFAFIETGLTDINVADNIRSDPLFFSMVVGLIFLVLFLTGFKIHYPIWKALAKDPKRMEVREAESLVGSLLRMPFNVAVLTSLGWVVAGIIFSFVPEILGWSHDVYWQQSLRHFVGIVCVGAPFAVISVYLTLEWYLRRKIRALFPSHLLVRRPSIMRINVLPKMTLVSLIIGIAPVSVVSYITLSRIYEIYTGRLSIVSFLAQMPLVIGFLLVLAVTVAVLLSISLAHSISEPLKEAAQAMEQIRRGDVEVAVPVLSNDEIGFMAEGFNSMVRGLKELDFIRETFGSYLSPVVVNEILKSPEGVNLGGELREVTVLVSDLRDFTSLSASLTPDLVVKILNSYLERMVDIVVEHDGIIDEFTGDGILAFFGAPRGLPDSPLCAVRCALAMQAAMASVNDELHNTLKDVELTAAHTVHGPLLPLRMGIGINTGPMIVGNIGSEKRKKYGAVGAPINVAFRVVSEATGDEVLVTADVQEKIGGALDSYPIPGVELKGFQKPVTLYRVLGLRENDFLTRSARKGEGSPNT